WSLTARILLADQKVFPIAPAIEEAIHVAFREPLAFTGLRRLPQPVLVLDEGQTGEGDGPTAARAQPEAEFDVGHAVETEPRIEPARRECIGAAKSQAVALDRVDVGTRAGVEFPERALAAEAERPRHGDGRVGEGLEERRDGIPV